MNKKREVCLSIYEARNILVQRMLYPCIRHDAVKWRGRNLYHVISVKRTGCIENYSVGYHCQNNLKLWTALNSVAD